MTIERRAYERVVRQYKLEIDEDYIADLNDSLDRRFPDGHPEITMAMVLAVVHRDDDVDIPELEFIVEKDHYRSTLADWIWEWIDEDIWDDDNSDVIDGETEDYEDDITLTDEEDEIYEKLVNENC